MGIIDRLEAEYVDVSTSRRSGRELLELAVGAAVFVAVGTILVGYLLGRAAGLAAGAVLTTIFVVTIVSQAYWAAIGRRDYRE